MLKFEPVEVNICNVGILAASPFTEIYVINAQFQRIASILGEGHVSVNTGTYTFRFQEGDFARDKIVYVDTEMKVTDPLFDKIERNSRVQRFRSKGSATGTPDFTTLIQEEKINFGIHHPERMVYARDERARYSSRVKSVELTRFDALTLSTDDWRNADYSNDRPKLFNFEFAFDDEIYNLPIIMNSQCELFIGVQSGKGMESLVLSMIVGNGEDTVREFHAFAQDSHYLNLSKLAMQALSNKRNVVSKQALKFLTEQKMMLPWHGLLALHLQIQKPEPKIALINIMIRNLRRLFGIDNHPDIISIEWWLYMQAPNHVNKPPCLKYPPVLSSSWKLLLMAYAHYRKDVIPFEFSIQYEKKMTLKGPWVPHRTNQLDSHQVEQLIESTRQAICEYLIETELAWVVESDDKSNLLKLSYVSCVLLKQASDKFSEDKNPVCLLASQIFEPIDKPEEIEFLGSMELFNCLETEVLLEKIMLSTAHSIHFLLQVIQLESEPNSIVVDSGHSSEGGTALI